MTCLWSRYLLPFPMARYWCYKQQPTVDPTLHLVKVGLCTSIFIHIQPDIPIYTKSVHLGHVGHLQQQHLQPQHQQKSNPKTTTRTFVPNECLM